MQSEAHSEGNLFNYVLFRCISSEGADLYQYINWLGKQSILDVGFHLRTSNIY